MTLEEQFKEGVAKILGYAVEEARTLRHNYVGTEHLLLGLLHYEQPQMPAATQDAQRPQAQDAQFKFMWSQIEEIIKKHGAIPLKGARPLEQEVVDLLQDAHADYMRIRDQTLSLIGKGEKEIPAEAQLGLTSRSRKAMDHAYTSYINDKEPRLPMSIHILYGLLMEGEGVAAGILESSRITLQILKPLAEKYRPKPA